MPLRLNLDYTQNFITQTDVENAAPAALNALDLLKNKAGVGGEFCGWINNLIFKDFELIEEIKFTADNIRKDCDVLIVVGIGGSYLGAAAAIEFLNGADYNLHKSAKIIFAGNNLSGRQLAQTLKFCENKSVYVCAISKSGTTIEPACAFKILEDYMINRYCDLVKDRIICITDKSRGVLREIADSSGYKSFIIPDDIGGRYSIFTPVGLLPIAIAGGDIDALLRGARQAEDDFLRNYDINKNLALKYAVLRNFFYNSGKKLEVTAGFEPNLKMLLEWHKQLFGESEGKDGKGLYPAPLMYSTDLHSLGQYVQDGERIMFETFITVKLEDSMTISDSEDLHKLQFLNGKFFEFINEKAFLGTIKAHASGGVPCINLELDDLSEFTLGYLLTFFMISCGVSAYMLGVNPFNQPGVEQYKSEMFKLLKNS